MMRSLLFLFLAVPALMQGAAPDAEALFKTNCSACHLPDEQVVGPSMVEISKIYEKDLSGFIDWTKNPVRKRDQVIEMPTMAHIPEDQLTMIHAHILKSATGLTEKKKRGGDFYATSPTIERRPNVLRIFMPGAGPAAFAVALDDTTSYCWDAGACRFRYAWKGGYIDPYPVWRGNGNGLATIKGEVFLNEADSPLPQVVATPAEERHFLGYRMERGLPTFRYKVGDTTFTERIAAADGKLTRTFTVNPAPSDPLTLELPYIEGGYWSSTSGSTEYGALTLSPAEAANFTLVLNPL